MTQFVKWYERRWPLVALVHLALVLYGQHGLAHQYQLLGPLKFSMNLHIFLMAWHRQRQGGLRSQMFAVFLLIFLADIFLVLAGALPWFSAESMGPKMIGMAIFGCSYLRLMYLGRSWGGKDMSRASSLLILIALGFYVAVAWKKESLAPGALGFYLFMGAMGSTLVDAGQKIEGRFGNGLFVSGLLFFASEMVFGLANFWPGLTRNDPWLGNFIWATYIPGWIIMLEASTLINSRYKTSLSEVRG